MSVGHNISNTRKLKGFSQEALAGRSGLSLRTIQRIETGAATPRPFTLKAIADALSVEISELDLSGSPAGDDTHLSVLRLINSSALLVLIFPVLNIIVPLMIWRRHKAKINLADPAKKIISFQLLWTVVSIITIIAGQLISYRLTGQQFIGRFPPALIIYLVMVGLNVLFIIRASVQLKNGSMNIYSSIPAIF